MNLKASNSLESSVNSRIKTIRVRSSGFRDEERLATAIYFNLVGLYLAPEDKNQFFTKTGKDPNFIHNICGIL